MQGLVPSNPYAPLVKMLPPHGGCAPPVKRPDETSEIDHAVIVAGDGHRPDRLAVKARAWWRDEGPAVRARRPARPRPALPEVPFRKSPKGGLDLRSSARDAAGRRERRARRGAGNAGGEPPLVERGGRFVQVYVEGAVWDHHDEGLIRTRYKPRVVSELFA